MAVASKGKRLSDTEYLINKMIELSNNEDKLILNSSIYDSLGWDRSKFIKVRNKLYEQDILTYEGHYTKFVNYKLHGRPRPTHKIFVSYSHADENYKDELLKHLAPLVHLNLIESWHDRKMLAGDHIESEITKQLNSSNLVLILVSSDFLNSPYCYHIEMENAVSRHKKGETILIPLILRHCYWQETPFKDLLAATKDGKPVASYPTRDEAFKEVVTSIRNRIAAK